MHLLNYIRCPTIADPQAALDPWYSSQTRTPYSRSHLIRGSLLPITPDQRRRFISPPPLFYPFHDWPDMAPAGHLRAYRSTMWSIFTMNCSPPGVWTVRRFQRVPVAHPNRFDLFRMRTANPHHCPVLRHMPSTVMYLAPTEDLLSFSPLCETLRNIRLRACCNSVLNSCIAG